MKRHIKKNPKSSESKEKILETALHIFSRYGYDGTTVRDICKEAGMSVGILNYHWGSKEELWFEVCELCSRRIYEAMLRAADFTRPPKEAMPKFLGALFDDLLENTDLLRIVMWFTLEAESFDYESTRNHFRPLVQFGAAFLREHGYNSKRGVDLEMTMTALRAQLVFMLVDRSGHENTFGKSLSDPKHAARVKKEFIKSAMLMLGITD